MASSMRVWKVGVECKNFWSCLDIAIMVLPPCRCDMDTPCNWGVVVWPVFPGVLVSAVRLRMSGENSCWGKKKCGGNKSGYATVSVSEDGAQTTRPGEVLRVCGSLSRALVRVGKGAWCTHTQHAHDSSNASCRTWRRPIIWRAGSRGMTRTPKMSCRKHSYGHTNFLAIFMGEIAVPGSS